MSVKYGNADSSIPQTQMIGACHLLHLRKLVMKFHYAAKAYMNNCEIDVTSRNRINCGLNLMESATKEIEKYIACGLVNEAFNVENIGIDQRLAEYIIAFNVGLQQLGSAMDPDNKYTNQYAVKHIFPFMSNNMKQLSKVMKGSVIKIKLGKARQQKCI